MKMKRKPKTYSELTGDKPSDDAAAQRKVEVEKEYKARSLIQQNSADLSKIKDVKTEGDSDDFLGKLSSMRDSVSDDSL